MDPRIRFRHLRCFIEVARRESVTRAAEALNTAQPSISRSIAELEEIMGTALFKRHSRGLQLTAAGETFMFYAESALAQLVEGVAQASGRSGTRTLRLGILPNVTREIVPEVILKFKLRHPGVTVRIVADDLLPKLRSGEIEAMVGRMMQPHRVKGLSFEHLYTEPLVFAVRSGHPLAGRDQPRLAEIDDFAVIVPLPGTVIRDALDQFLIARGRHGFSNTVETITFEFARPYVLSSDAIVVLPLGAMRAELADGRMALLDIGGEELSGPVGITYVPTHEFSPPMRSLLGVLRDVMREKST